MLLALLLAALPAAPPTPKQPVTDTYFGVEVKDDYRWLEKSSDPEVQKWSDAQNARARAVLDAFPGRAMLTAHLEALLGFEAASWSGVESAGGRVFALERQPPNPQPVLVLLETLAPGVPKRRVLLDPAAYDPTGSTSIDFYVPSLDGKYVAVSLSSGGSEHGDAHVFEVDTGKELRGDVVVNVHNGTAGGSLAWTSDGFFYTRNPRAGERPKEDLEFFQQVAFHKLGTDPKTDVLVLSKELERISENFLTTSRDGKWAADLVQRGDGGEFELYLKGAKGWTKLARFEDRVVDVELGAGKLYLLSKKGAPRGKVLELALTEPLPTLDKATVFLPEGPAPIVSVRAGKQRVFVTVQRGGPTGVRVYGLDGKLLAEPPLEDGVTAGSLTVLEGDEALVLCRGWLLPNQLRLVRDGKLVPTPFAAQSPADLRPYEAVRDECTSKDGTKIPLTIVRKKGLKLDGAAPARLTGYGGFNIAYGPGFNATLPLWLERGGVFAVANLRGGSELGEPWHEAGMKTKKQNVFDDFIACAERLVAMKVTNPKRLVIEGGSNGGLLVGAALTQRPELFAAVVAHVGYFDMLRFEAAPNGAFNTTEYGSVKNEDELKALAAYSPYHRVKDGVQYPPVLLMTGANDPRVEPFHSRKFAARLQASGTKAPVLLRTSSATGHGMGTPLKEQIASQVDVTAFIFQALGLTPKTLAPRFTTPK